MNRVLETDDTFDVGRSVAPQTAGVWLAHVPCQIQGCDAELLVIDSEVRPCVQILCFTLPHCRVYSTRYLIVVVLRRLHCSCCLACWVQQSS